MFFLRPFSYVMKKIDLEMVRVWLEEIQYAALLQAVTNFEPFNPLSTMGGHKHAHPRNAYFLMSNLVLFSQVFSKNYQSSKLLYTSF